LRLSKLFDAYPLVSSYSQTGEEILKKTELRLIAELMKNSRRSDRELSRVLGISQPTVSRMIRKLEKEGVIKEYTMIPDFRKLGFEIMALNLIKLKKEPNEEETKKLKDYGDEYEKRKPFALALAVSGMGAGYNRATISFHENYSSLMEFINESRQTPWSDFYGLDTFIISLAREDHYRFLTFSTAAKHLSMMK
jgi:DNA-binding Lrp family transcriptional regulator